MIRFAKQYAGFIVGLVFGASVATLTTYFLLYDPEQIYDFMDLQDCLEQKLKHQSSSCDGDTDSVAV